MESEGEEAAKDPKVSTLSLASISVLVLRLNCQFRSCVHLRVQDYGSPGSDAHLAVLLGVAPSNCGSDFSGCSP